MLNCQSAPRSAPRLGILRNRWLAGRLLLSVALHAAVLYWTPLAHVFHKVPIRSADLAGLMAMASRALWAEELRKWIARAGAGAKERKHTEARAGTAQHLP